MWQRRPSVSGKYAEEAGHYSFPPPIDHAPVVTVVDTTTSSTNRRIMPRSPDRSVSVVGILLAFPCLVFAVVFYSHHKNTSNSNSIQPQRALDTLIAFPNLFFWNLKGTIKVGVEEEAAIVGISPGRVGEWFDALNPLTDALDMTADVEGFNAAWEGFWLRNGRTCLADSTKRLKEAVESACDVVLLLPGHIYHLKKMINVWRPITLIGNPAERPIINAAKAERAFWVHSKASMDIRHIMFYEGEGDVIRNEIRTRFGGVVYLSSGANLFAFDCLFTIQPTREAIFNDRPEFIFGGDLLMVGGVMNILACSFFAIVPGFVNSISTEIGGSVLILGGKATFTLVNFMTTQIFAFNAGSGMHLALLGGAMSMQACTHTANLVFAVQGIVGRNIFVGGGIGVFTGCVITDSICFLAFYGAGFSIFIGAGGGIFAGCEIMLNSAIGHKAGVGIAVAVGAGTGLFYGTVFSKNLGITLFNTLGVFIFVGTGRLALVGCPFAHQNAIAAWQLLGGAIYLGTGQAVVIGCVFTRSLGLDSFTGLGGDIFVGAGQLVLVHSVFTSNTGITAFLGQGSDLYLAAGSAYIKHVNASINAGIHLVSEDLAGFYVAGRECEVKTLESDAITKFKERGYALCYKGLDGNEKEEIEGEGVALVVVQNLQGRQRLGGWRGWTLPDTSPALLYLGGNISSCQICGLDNVEVQGPATGACYDAEATEPAVCPADQSPRKTAALAGEPPVVIAPVANTIIDSSSSSNSTRDVKNKLFGLNARVRRLIAGRSENDRVRQATEATEAAAAAAADDDHEPDAFLPDTYVITADLVLNCSSLFSTTNESVVVATCGCGTTARELQDLLEESWLKDLGAEDDTTVVITPFKSSDSLLETLGILSINGRSNSSGSSSNPSEPSTACTKQEIYATYLHTTDKVTFEKLKHSLLATDSSSSTSGRSNIITLLSSRLSLLLAALYPQICHVNLTLQDSLFVPPPVKNPTSSIGTAASSDSSGNNRPSGISGGITLPRVWVNITTPVISVGNTYQVAISDFDDGDRVGLQLVASFSKDKKDKKATPSLFFQSTPRPLYTFRPFDALAGNQTWGWQTSALTFRGMGSGPFFLKAFDILEPKRFVLSQAFELEGVTATAGTVRGLNAGTRNAGTSSATLKTRAEHIVRRLSGQFSGSEEEEEQQDIPKLEDNDDSNLNLISIMSTLLVSPNSEEAFSITRNLWKALLALPSSQKALKNPALARQLLERVPALQTAPAILALDANGEAGWKDSVQIQAAMGKAIADFMDMSLSALQQQRRQQQKQKAGALFRQNDEGVDTANQWPTKIFESLTPEEEALAKRIAQERDIASMNVLMDSQAARRFGGMTMARLQDAGVGEDIKEMLGSTDIFRDLIDDPELWKAL